MKGTASLKAQIMSIGAAMAIQPAFTGRFCHHRDNDKGMMEAEMHAVITREAAVEHC